MINRLKDKYFLLSAITIIMFVFIFTQLIKLQIVDSKEYLAKSESYLSTEEIIQAPRGKILDRYGRPIVTNRLGFSVSFCDTSMSDDKLNDLIVNTVTLFEKNNDEYIDTFPIEYINGEYVFSYGNMSGDELETKVRNSKFAIGISDNYDAAQCIDALKEKFNLDNRYTPEQIRDIIAVRYEMVTRDFKHNGILNFSSDVSINSVSAIEENSEMFLGLRVNSAPVREYVHGSMAAHILGRVGIIYQEEYALLKDSGYGMNAVIGKDGLEKTLEKDIKGTDGKRSVSQSVGEEPKIEETAAISGNNAMLTIDIDLQKTAEKALMETIESIKANSWSVADNAGSDVGGGAVVVMDVKTGEILAMASYPTFDPASFNRDYEALSSDNSKPLFNRALSGTYPPGSVFKVLTTIAALEENIINPYTVIEDKGQYEYYDQVFNCWIYSETGTTHGPMDAVNALKNSCNYFYYEVAKKLGADKIVEYANKMNLGKPTGIEIEGEVAGVLATAEYKETNFNEVWYPGDTLQMAIGQSYNLFTPLQLVNYTSTIANKGTIYQPYLTKCIRDSGTGEIISQAVPIIKNNMFISDTTYDVVTKGMRLVSYDGTASSIFGDFPIETCSKTGSSQVNGGSANGVFVSYAPYVNPQIAISIVVENAGSGSVTAPIAKAIYSEYFNLNPHNSDDLCITDNSLIS
ncbi:MAG: hypothetical protein II998_07415 [Clostridia bacterium]|nr:hypothetical protein [Clostridia bacterium]